MSMNAAMQQATANRTPSQESVDSIKALDSPGETPGEKPSVDVRNIDIEAAEEDLQAAVAHGLNDPNLPQDVAERIEHALATGDKAAEAELEAALLEDSIYPEVRAAVSNVDDPSLPVNTFRSWLLGMIFVILLSGLNQFFSFRQPSVLINGLVAQLVSYPCGLFLARVLPTKQFTLPYFGAVSLNPGPFNIKEHTLISVMASVVYNGAYASEILAVQRFYYDQRWGAGYSILLCLSSNIIGFSFAGFCRRWLIWPGSMIWPSQLVSAALLTTFHNPAGDNNAEGRIGRGRWFVYVFLGAFFWYFFPGFIFTALSYFSWICWMKPNNVVVNQLFGVNQGLGMGVLTFDWAQITFIGVNPLASPWFAEANVLAGLVIFYWICAPIIYYTNTNFATYLPMSTSHVFDRFGKRYNTSRITVNGRIDEAAYAAYSKQYLSATFQMSYGLSFASVAAILVHTALYSAGDLKRMLRTSLANEADIHARLMSRYREVPQWWYICTFLVSFALALVTIEVWDTELPVWGLILAILIGAIFVLPIGMVYAVTNQQVGLNVITEFIIGYVRPGRPIAMMIFKTFGYISMYQALSFLGDQKLTHYMKLPPRTVFMAQLSATFVGVIVLLGVQAWVFNNVDGVCTSDATDHFTCPNVSVFASASIIWGLLGPARNFSSGQLYNSYLYFFLIGAAMPVPTYFLAKRYPKSLIRYVNWPVIFTGTGLIPPATGINYASWALVGFIFQYVIRRRYFGWWVHKNYVTAAALDSGTGLAIVFIFFTLIFPKSDKLDSWNSGTWWGNLVWQNTADALGTTYNTPSGPEGAFDVAPDGMWHPRS